MGRKQLQQTSVFPARIRMTEPVWRHIVETNHRNDEKDPVQQQLVRLIHENPHAKERILVTGDDATLDCLRDWCADMVVDGTAMENNGQPVAGNTLRKEAARVIDLIDKYDAKMMGVTRVFRS
jgi:hypothetical protein